MRKSHSWDPHSPSVLKFNVDRAAKGKAGARVGGVLHNSEGIVLTLFSKLVGCMESNEVEVFAILEVRSSSGFCSPLS